MPKLTEYIYGKKPKLKQVPTQSPQQQQLTNMILEALGGGKGGQGGGFQDAFAQLLDLLNPEGQAYENFSAPYMRQFEEQTIPGLAERFAGFGSNPNSGALSSSGFGQALGAAGAGLQEKLAQLRGNLQQQGRQDLFSLINPVLGKDTFAYQQKPGSKGFVGGGAEGLAAAIPFILSLL